MLVEIYIQNFVLIDELRMEFEPGLNVLTGETGAGKSIIIDALGLVMGERVKNEFIRDSSKKALVEASFEINLEEFRNLLQEQGILAEDESMLIVSREISPGGRNIVRINNRIVSAAYLKEITAWLLDMHVQNERSSLFENEKYLHIVDDFAPEADSMRNRIASVYHQWQEKEQKLLQWQQEENHRLQKIDFLSFQVKEIDAAKLYPGEEEELQSLRSRIRNAEKISAGSRQLINMLYRHEDGNSAHDLISLSLDVVRSLMDEPDIAGLKEPLEEILFSLQEMAGTVSDLQDSLDFQPSALDEIENRLYLIERLKSKYGSNIEEVLAFYRQAQQELEELENYEQVENNLRSEADKLQQEYYLIADQLSAIRREAASRLQEMVRRELVDLHMPHITFEVIVIQKASPAANGYDDIEFMFSANPGESPRPLSKVASGGEISRFILALKSALASTYRIPTLVFDEIDVGVGGTALGAMADKLYQIAADHQVILVTHAAQVASYAHCHYLIDKQVENNSTFVQVTRLQQETREQEIARMLGGYQYSDITLQHARELLKRN
ncbi:MAG: DNA repair protein RecN [Syntrophomonadaceae bacterium]|nr:DNA repair protein RecN [Syntrophomonadaceae bacterium]